MPGFAKHSTYYESQEKTQSLNRNTLKTLTFALKLVKNKHTT